METIEEVPFWLSKYYQYMTNDCIGKMYKAFHNCKFTEMEFLSYAYKHFNWREYMNTLSNKQLKIDSVICKLFGEKIVHFWYYANSYNILSLEDAELYKDRLN